MKLLFIKDKVKRDLFFILEKKKIILYYILQNLNFSYNLRLKAYKKLKKFSAISCGSKIKNRCVLSNRAKSIYQNFKISRIFLKNLALEGQIMGIKKASW